MWTVRYLTLRFLLYFCLQDPFLQINFYWVVASIYMCHDHIMFFSSRQLFRDRVEHIDDHVWLLSAIHPQHDRSEFPAVSYFFRRENKCLQVLNLSYSIDYLPSWTKLHYTSVNLNLSIFFLVIYCQKSLPH